MVFTKIQQEDIQAITKSAINTDDIIKHMAMKVAKKVEDKFAEKLIIQLFPLKILFAYLNHFFGGGGVGGLKTKMLLGGEQLDLSCGLATTNCRNFLAIVAIVSFIQCPKQIIYFAACNSCIIASPCCS